MVYLDNNATTRALPEVREAMQPWLDDDYGNPSAGYRFGRRAREAVDGARERVAALVEAHPEEIVFTSGGTESINTALRSALALRPDHRTLLASSAEHSAVEKVVKFFDQTGYDGRFNPVDSLGRLDLDHWREVLDAGDVAVATLLWANNETGVLGPVAEAAALAAERDVHFHTDAVQAVGKVPVSVDDLPVQALSMSAHKLHGPKGVGALYLDRHAPFHPLLLGGGQENERRSGTENVPGIVGFGVAAEKALERLEQRAAVAELRDAFERGVREAIDDVEINGDPENRLPNTTNLHFPGVDGEGLLILLDEAGVCCSPGSACSTGSVEPSRVVKAMGYSNARARSSVRFSLSHFTTREEVDEAVAAVRSAVEKLRVVMPSGGGRVVGGSAVSRVSPSG